MRSSLISEMWIRPSTPGMISPPVAESPSARNWLRCIALRAFSAIWRETQDPLMLGLRELPRRVGGRCAKCSYFDVCGGNTRVRAWQLTGDAWAEDPGCYLDDDELGIERGGERIAVTPYTRVRRRPVIPIEVVS